MTISELKKLLEEAQEKAHKNQKIIDNGQVQRAVDLAWHDAIAGYSQKVEQAYCAPDDIIAAIRVAENETGTLVCQAKDILEALQDKGFVAQALRAYNKMGQAKKHIDDIKQGMEAIDNEGFEQSEIKSTLDAIIASAEDYREKSTEALYAMMNSVRQVVGLEHAITCDWGLNQQFEELKNLASLAKSTTEDFWTTSDTEHKAAKAKKKEWDTLFAKQELYNSLVTSYRTALAAIEAD